MRKTSVNHGVSKRIKYNPKTNGLQPGLHMFKSSLVKYLVKGSHSISQ